MTDLKNKAVIVVQTIRLGLGWPGLGKSGCHLTGYYRMIPMLQIVNWDQLIHVANYNEIVEKLVEFGTLQKHKSALFVSADNLVKVISDNRDILRQYYSFLLPEKNVIDCFLDKTSFHEWAMQNGMKVPESYICSSYEELDSCLERISFPVIIKPFEKTEKWDQLSPAYKTIQLHCKSEIDTIPFDLFVAASKILVQQWIPGGDRNVYFCLVCYNGNGQKMADFTGRKLFQWPVLCGSTAAAIGEENEEVGRMTEEIFNLVKYQGLGSVEFSSDDGHLHLNRPGMTFSQCRGDL
jgi:predicted ATP-grasp superfamily ATP-dependent carboligase